MQRIGGVPAPEAAGQKEREEKSFEVVTHWFGAGCAELRLGEILRGLEKQRKSLKVS